MEIKSNLTQCPQGHYYNAALHSSCPICNGVGVTVPAGGAGAASAGNFPPTMKPDEIGTFSPTMAPGEMGGYSGNMTIPVNNFRDDGPEPFEPTMIGGDQSADGQLEPVVGWLVCIDGPVRGTDFRIHAGYNYIGREVGDIHIHGDNQISRQNHAMIAFDSSELTYYVGPSAGRNLIKVNGKTVLNAVEIHNYDVISIGTTKLMFVGLCGEHFTWTGGKSHE